MTNTSDNMKWGVICLRCWTLRSWEILVLLQHCQLEIHLCLIVFSIGNRLHDDCSLYASSPTGPWHITRGCVLGAIHVYEEISSRRSNETRCWLQSVNLMHAKTPPSMRCWRHRTLPTQPNGLGHDFIMFSWPSISVWMQAYRRARAARASATRPLRSRIRHIICIQVFYQRGHWTCTPSPNMGG